VQLLNKSAIILIDFFMGQLVKMPPDCTKSPSRLLVYGCEKTIKKEEREKRGRSPQKCHQTSKEKNE
jgi:hypothetical protein